MLTFDGPSTSSIAGRERGSRRQGLSSTPAPAQSRRLAIIQALWSDRDDGPSSWSEPNADEPPLQSPYSVLPLPLLRAAPRRVQPSYTPIRIDEIYISQPPNSLEEGTPLSHIEHEFSHSTPTCIRVSSEPPRVYNSLLEEKVKQTTTLAELEDITRLHPIEGLEPKEVVLFCNHLARITNSVTTTVREWSQTNALYDRLLLGLSGRLDELSSYQLVVLLSSMARLRHQPSEVWLDAFFSVSEPHLKECGTGNLSTLIRALSKLPLDPWVIKSVPSFSAWLESYLALSQKKMVAFRGDELVKVISSLSGLLYRPAKEWMDSFSYALKVKLPTMDVPLISSSMLAFATLSYEPEPHIMKSYYIQLYSKLPMFDDQDLATTAQAFAILRRLIKQDFFEEFLAETIVKLPSFSSSATANLLVALATLLAPKKQGARVYIFNSHKSRSKEYLERRKVEASLKVSDQFLRAFSEMIRERMWQFSGDSLANSLWGLMKLGFKPDPLFAELSISVSQTKLYTMKTTEMTRMISVIGSFSVVLRSEAVTERVAFDSWCRECTKLVVKREYNMENCCQLIEALSLLPKSEKYIDQKFIRKILQVTRSRNVRSVTAHGIASLARALRVLGHKPDFAFMHNFSQVARYKWTEFSPDDYAELIAAMAEFSCAKSADPLWTTEFLAIIQCRFHEFPPSAMTLLLSSAVNLPGIKPGAQWLALAVARVQRSCQEYSAEQMARVLIALCKFNYRPPADVFDLFVQHVSSRSETLSPALTDQLSDSLTLLVSSYILDGPDGHLHYQDVQMRLRRTEVPMRVISQDFSAQIVHENHDQEGSIDKITVVGENGSEREVSLKPKRSQRSRSVEILT